MLRLAAPLAIALVPAAALSETRCGWIDNPTPANWWLTDAAGEWTIGIQGGVQAGGMDLIPDLTQGEWVATNGSYGYGCACLSVMTDPDALQILSIARVTQKPLSACANDPALPPRPAP